jgi:hypothetical protein
LSVLCKESDYRISFKVKLPQERFSGINEWSAARLTSNKENMSFLKRISALSSRQMKKEKLQWNILGILICK